MRWESHVEYFDLEKGGGTHGLNDWLRHISADGWQLVNVVPCETSARSVQKHLQVQHTVGTSMTVTSLMVFIKREVPE